MFSQKSRNPLRWEIYAFLFNIPISAYSLKTSNYTPFCVIGGVLRDCGMEFWATVFFVWNNSLKALIFRDIIFWLKGTLSRDFLNYLRVFDAKCVFFVWPMMIFKFLYCLVIFKIENKVLINISQIHFLICRLFPKSYYKYKLL